MTKVDPTISAATTSKINEGNILGENEDGRSTRNTDASSTRPQRQRKISMNLKNCADYTNSSSLSDEYEDVTNLIQSCEEQLSFLCHAK